MARKKKANTNLTPLELEMMQVLWARGSSTVQDVQSGLKTALAYTTVQTVLNVLLRKGRVRRSLEGRAYVYRAAAKKDAVAGQTLKDLIDRMFGGSSEELVMSLVKARHIDHARLIELSQLIKAEGEPPDD